MEVVQAVKKLISISRERLNFKRRPISCTTLYRNPTQASNFGGTFNQLFLWIFLSNFHRRCLSTSSIPWCKKVKNDQKLKSKGPALTLCEATARSTKLRKTQSYKSVFYQKKEALLLITTLPCLKAFVSLITKNKSKSSWHTEKFAKIVSKRSHQEECVHSAKTAKFVASCVASQVLQVSNKFPSFPSKAQSIQIER